MKELNLLKTFNYKTQMKWVFSYIERVRALVVEKGVLVNYKKVQKDVIVWLNKVDNLTQNQRKQLSSVFMRVIKKTVSGANFGFEKKNFDELYKACRRVQLDVRQKVKLEGVRAQLKDSESVFVMCSKHYPVAPDHKDYQGKLYVNQNWRNLVEGRYYRAVSEYIKNNDVLTIQSVMKNPPYLITRPNCRHKLVVVPVSAVLKSVGDKTVLNEYRKESHSKKAHSKRDYYTLREECRAILEQRGNKKG